MNYIINPQQRTITTTTNNNNKTSCNVVQNTPCYLFKVLSFQNVICYKNPRGRGLPTPHPTLYSERVDSLLFFDGSFFIRVLCVSYWKSCWIFANEFIICCFLVKKHLFGISVEWKLARKTVPFHKNTPIGSSALLTSTTSLLQLFLETCPWDGMFLLK